MTYSRPVTASRTLMAVKRIAMCVLAGPASGAKTYLYLVSELEMQMVRLIHEKSGSVIGDRIVCADTTLLRLKGLLGMREVLDGTGVWLQPSSGVHTFGMRFAIDVLGLDEHLHVVKLWAKLPPQRITTVHFRVKSVVELAAGSIEAHGIQLGDRFTVFFNTSENRRT